MAIIITNIITVQINSHFFSSLLHPTLPYSTLLFTEVRLMKREDSRAGQGRAEESRGGEEVEGSSTHSPSFSKEKALLW